jgi:hypothetical protein
MRTPIGIYVHFWHATTRPRACAHNPIWLRIRTLPAPAAEDASCPTRPCSLSVPPIPSPTGLPFLPSPTTSYLTLPAPAALILFGLALPCPFSSHSILSPNVPPRPAPPDLAATSPIFQCLARSRFVLSRVVRPICSCPGPAPCPIRPVLAYSHPLLSFPSHPAHS